MRHFSNVALVVLACVVFFVPKLVSGQGVEASEFPSPQIPDGKLTVKLPSTVNDVRVGGDGRFVLLHFKTLKKIGLLDISQAKLVHYFPATEDDTVFAAGATKLLIATGNKGVVSRYDLLSHKKELTQSIDVGGLSSQMWMGSATEGPAYISGVARSYDGGAQVIDLDTLKTSRFETTGSNRRGFGSGARVRISADGQAFGQWAVGVSPSGLQTLVKSGDKWRGYYEHDSVGYILPSPDGRTIYTASGIFSSQLKRIGSVRRDRNHQGYPIPAVHGDYYLTVNGSRTGSSRSSKASEGVTLHLAGESRPIVKVNGLSKVFDDGDRWSRQTLTLDKRLMLIPKANVIVQLSTTHDSIEIHEFNLQKALDEAGIDYLVVRSRPPSKIKAGESMDYPINVLSKAGGVNYKLETGPEAMEVTKSGKVIWKTSTKSPPENQVIISVSDKSGQEVFHSFKVRVVGGTGESSDNVVVAKTPAELDAGISKVEKIKLDEDLVTVKLPSTVSDVVHAGGGRYMLLHFDDLKKVGLFDVTKAKITKYFPAVDPDSQIAGGKNHLLVVNQNQGVVSRYNLTTMKRELSKALPFTGKIQYLAMGANSLGPAAMRVASGSGALDKCTFEFMDLNTLSRIDVEWQRHPHSSFRDFNQIYPSADGKSFSILGVGPLRLDGNKVQLKSSRSGQGYRVPSHDGSYFVSTAGVLNSDLRQVGRVEKGNNWRRVLIPAIAGNYYLEYAQNDSDRRPRSSTVDDKCSAKLFIYGESRPLVTINDMVRPGSYSNRPTLPPHQRVMFAPHLNVIVSLAVTNDKIVLRNFAIDQALEESGVDYLVVMSVAPTVAKPGSTYKYELDVKSKKGGLKYVLDSAPEGMKISPKGAITWNVPANIEQTDHKVIVTVADAIDQEVFHNFSVEISELKEKVPAKKTAEAEKRKKEIARDERERREKARQSKIEMEMRRKKLSEANAPRQEASQVPVFKFREWTDASGKHKFVGKFFKIIDHRTVLLTNQSGKQIQIELSKLSSPDIYEAVKNDLLRLDRDSNLETESPFKNADESFKGP